MCLPIAFFKNENVYGCSAVLGLEPNNNLFVSSAGKWLGSYLPAIYRSYPFNIAVDENGQAVLCFDAESGLEIGDEDSSSGYSFFVSESEPGVETAKVLQFLKSVQTSSLATEQVCNLLDELGLFEDWPVTLEVNGEQKQVNGLLKINERKLQSLSPEQLARMAEAGAFMVCYCQLLSMQHLNDLIQYYQKKSGKGQPPSELSFSADEGGGTLNFDNL